MSKRSSKKKKRPDINELASEIVKQATIKDQDKKTQAPDQNESAKNPAAVVLGRLGGLKGGKARAKKLTAEQRRKIARKAALTRWRKSSDDEKISE